MDSGGLSDKFKPRTTISRSPRFLRVSPPSPADCLTCAQINFQLVNSLQKKKRKGRGKHAEVQDEKGGITEASQVIV